LILIQNRGEVAQAGQGEKEQVIVPPKKTGMRAGGLHGVFDWLRVMTVTGTVAAILIAGTCVIDRHLSDRDQLATDLAATLDLWNHQDIQNYSYMLAIGCDSCSSAHGHFSVFVSADTVGRVTRDTTFPGSFSTSDTGSIPTIRGLFHIIQNGLAISNSVITARFNSVLGYPESIRVDYDTRVTGDEYTYRADSVVTP
jgi:hypothetical protein